MKKEMKKIALIMAASILALSSAFGTDMSPKAKQARPLKFILVNNESDAFKGDVVATDESGIEYQLEFGPRQTKNGNFATPKIKQLVLNVSKVGDRAIVTMFSIKLENKESLTDIQKKVEERLRAVLRSKEVRGLKGINIESKVGSDGKTLVLTITGAVAKDQSAAAME